MVNNNNTQFDLIVKLILSILSRLHYRIAARTKSVESTGICRKRQRNLNSFFFFFHVCRSYINGLRCSVRFLFGREKAKTIYSVKIHDEPKPNNTTMRKIKKLDEMRQRERGWVSERGQSQREKEIRRSDSNPTRRSLIIRGTWTDAFHSKKRIWKWRVGRNQR